MRSRFAARLGLDVVPGSTGARPPSAVVSIAASAWRCRSVIDPTVFVSDMGTWARSLRQACLTPAALAHQQVGTAMPLRLGGQ